jgi:uncharacterized membrane protein YfcA
MMSSISISIQISDLSPIQWFWLLFSALLTGMAKAGIKGMGLIVVPLLASVFGGKPSAGLLLPMLVMADVFAVQYYNRHARWQYLWKLLPAAVVGILIGVWIGKIISDDIFKSLIVVFILSCLVLMLWQERGGLPTKVTQSWYFGVTFGLIGGFSTMIGNAAGPFMTVYLLSTRLPKNNFIGTGAWFFFLVNLFKVPFHVYIWKTITWSSFQLNLLCIPVIALGILIGIRIIKWIPEKEFRYFIIIITTIVSTRLIWQTVGG